MFYKKKLKSLLDLGSCPGGWSQVASKIITNGKILSIDIKDMKPINNVKFIKADILQNDTKDIIIAYFQSKLDIIISDMAADTTGNRSLDSIRTNQLSAEIINLSNDILKPKGVLVSKVFMGEDFIEVKILQNLYLKLLIFFKPDSSRSESKETYIHCDTFKTL